MNMPQVVSTVYARLDELADQGVLDSRWWLSLAERIELDRIGNPQRQGQWLAARWLAKQSIQSAIGDTRLADIQLLARDEQGRGVRPQIRVAGRKLPWSVSISHSERGVLVGLASGPSSVGVDLVDIRPDRATRYGAGFRRLWFAPSEQRWLTADPQRRIATLWALKEAVYKASNAGEAFFPRQVEIVPTECDGFCCLYRGLRLEHCSLSVRELDNHVAAVAEISLAPTHGRFNIPPVSQPAAIFRKPS
jgi:phosphopantetheinyl transferase